MEKIKLEKPLLAPNYVWNAYAAVENVKTGQPKDELTALVSLIRRACGIDGELKPFDKTKNLKQITKELINAFDPDEIEKIAQVKVEATPVQDRTPGQYEGAIS